MEARAGGADEGRHGPDLRDSRVASTPARRSTRRRILTGQRMRRLHRCAVSMTPRRPKRDRVRRSARAASPACRRPRSRGCARSRGGWRWLLIVATAATILLCINQQFTLRFFVGYTQLNTEYFYLLIAVMLPFTFLIFPGSATRAARPRPLVRRGCCSSRPSAAAIYLMLNVRKAAELGWEFGGAPTPVDRRRPRHVGPADGGAAPHRRLEPAAERAALHGLSAVCRRALARAAARAPSRRSSRRPPITCSRARACSAFRSRPSPRR